MISCLYQFGDWPRKLELKAVISCDTTVDYCCNWVTHYNHNKQHCRLIVERAGLIMLFPQTNREQYQAGTE